MERTKKILLITIYLMLPFLSGYTFDTDAPWIKVNCSLGNNIQIYFSRNQIDYLEIDEDADTIINTGSSTIYGYTTNTRISFPVYDEPYYNSGYNSVNLFITDILEVHFYTTVTDIINRDLGFYTFVVLGGIMIWIMFHTKL